MITSQASLMTWLEEVPEALILISPRGEIIHANLKAQATLSMDLSANLMLGDIFDMLASMGTLTRSLIRLIPGEEKRIMMRHRQDPSRTFNVALRRSSRNEYIIVSLREEVELLDKFAQRDELESYRLLASNLPNCAMILFDRDMRYIIADGVALEAAGYKPEFFLGKTLHEALPDFVQTLEPIYKRALNGEMHDATVYSTTGGIYESTVIPVKDKDGEIQGGMLFILDISDRHEQLNKLDVQERSLSIYAQHMQVIQALIAHEHNLDTSSLLRVLDIPELTPRQHVEEIYIPELLHSLWHDISPPDYIVPFIGKPEINSPIFGQTKDLKALLQEILIYTLDTLPRTQESPLTFEIQYTFSLGMLSMTLSHRHPDAVSHTLPQTAMTMLHHLQEADPHMIALLRLRHLVLSCQGTLHTTHSKGKSRVVLNVQLHGTPSV